MASSFIVIVVLGLACIYTMSSAILIYSALIKVTGKELRHLMSALFITVIAGFFYGLIQLFNQLGMIVPGRQLALDYFSNFVLFTMFVMLVYLAFLTKELGRRFGFRIVGKRIKSRLESKNSRKHRS